VLARKSSRRFRAGAEPNLTDRLNILRDWKIKGRIHVGREARERTAPWDCCKQAAALGVDGRIYRFFNMRRRPLSWIEPFLLDECCDVSGDLMSICCEGVLRSRREDLWQEGCTSRRFHEHLLHEHEAAEALLPVNYNSVQEYKQW
jgi:hypothetical protein